MPFDLDDKLRAEYDQLFQTCSLRPERAPEVGSTVQRMAQHRERYAAVEHELHVPWFVVGTIHAMEGGLAFNRHLHNGDPLTGRTVQKPSGRPK
jgi:lysozyme family protein